VTVVAEGSRVLSKVHAGGRGSVVAETQGSFRLPNSHEMAVLALCCDGFSVLFSNFGAKKADRNGLVVVDSSRLFFVNAVAATTVF
jgi:hypothetical protein